MKKTCLVLLFTFLTISTSYAQWPVLAPDVLDTIQERKAEMFRYRKMMMAEAMQTPNQEQYDVRYYDIELEITPEPHSISGSVKMVAEILESHLVHIEVDFLDNMSVTGVTSAGEPAIVAHQNDLLDIQLERTYAPGDIIEVMIDYEGNPEASGLGSFGFDSHAGKPMIWSLSEPFGARNWWPCKDQPSDKADSVDIRVTVPKELIVASNGTLRSVTDNGQTRTYWWHESYPIATYLVSVAIYEYYTYSDYYKYSPTDSMEIKFYVFPDHLNDLREDYARTKDMIAIYSDLFGPYPFLREKYGHAEFVWGGGMEHQTCTSLGGWSESLIAHELAHMWWGDMITCRDFHHIWLNEGFATYAEALYAEQAYGPEQYAEIMRGNQYFGEGTIYVPDLTEVWRIFHGGLSYAKGACVLHMLRHVVGDTTFFDILKAYYASPYQHGSLTTEDFQAICESVAGMKLGWFFQQWIYGQYYPHYACHWSSIPEDDGFQVRLTIEQIQKNTDLFTMPIDVEFTARDQRQTVVLFDSLETQTFDLELGFAPVMVRLDRQEWILRKTIVTGDVTGEGEVDVSDILTTASFILKTKRPSANQTRAADVNGDGNVNVLDMVCMVNIILLEP